MFLIINSYERSIELKQGLFQVRLQKRLKSLSIMITIILFAPEDVFKDCIKVLVSLNTRLSSNLFDKRKAI